MLTPLRTTGGRLNIFIEGCDLPADTDDLRIITDELEAAILNVLKKHQITPDRLFCHDGHTYSSLKRECPICHHILKLSGFCIDYYNGGSADASCPSCGWHGRATYRIVDLYEYGKTPESQVPEYDSEDNSCLYLYDVKMDYYPC